MILTTAALAIALAGPPQPVDIFTLSDSSGVLPVAEAAADWSKNTDITVNVGECTGLNCIHLQVVPFACGYGWPVGGCAYRLEDGSCNVEVSQSVVSRGGYLDDLVTKHEAGHCIWRGLGYSQSAHLSDPRALMSASHSSSPTRQEATLSSIDRRFTRDLVAG